MNPKKILIINTGGTISSIKTERGYEPIGDYVETAMANLPLLRHSDLPSYTIHELKPLIDSSNMDLKDWNHIANCIADNAENYDGFVIFHGTDTMAYTACALSFMLEHLNTPVILTGSQIPLSAVRSDAVDNIVTSLWLCAHQPIHEVCIYFAQRLLRGNRARKISAQEFMAFDSPNYPALADIGVNITVHTHLLLPPTLQPFHLQCLKPSAITNFRLFPGMSLSTFHHLLQQPLQALILETFGAGNAPNHNPDFLDSMKQATDNGLIIINCSQCPHGHVEMDRYATGSSLSQAGLLSGYDMTPEAIHCKLLYLFSKFDDVKVIKQHFIHKQCGE